MPGQGRSPGVERGDEKLNDPVEQSGQYFTVNLTLSKI